MKIKKMLSVLLAAVVAVGSLALTAAAEVKDTSKDVSLTIFVNEAADESEVALDSAVTGERVDLSGKPVAGVSFLLYKTAADETSVTPPVGASAIVSGKTGEDGSVKIILPAAQQGRYLVIMNDADKPANLDGATVPFLVDLPMTDPNGTGFLYDVYAYPKPLVSHDTDTTTDSDTESDTDSDTESDTDSDTESDTDSDTESDTDSDTPDPKVSKKVSDDNGKTWKVSVWIAAAAGQRAYWKVSAEIPDMIDEMTVFTVGDVLDNRLIAPESKEVSASVNGTALPAGAFKTDISGQSISVSFDTKSLMKYTGDSVDVIFPTSIDLTAPNSVGVSIENIATLTYTKIGGAVHHDTTDTDSEEPGSDTSEDETTKITTTIVTSVVEVWTGEICGFKHNKSDEPLQGAEFGLYSDKDCKNEITRTVSDQNGYFWFRGILDGNYYIKELKAPDGYQLNSNIIEAKIDVGTKKPLEIDILNIPKPNLPVTGGAGILGVTIIGLSISVLGGFVIILSLRLRRKELCASA